ncbi:hypothetical protein [Methyloraptor flagellatus]|uniref:Uncharacterized protein n=1 Tax=Methyloraptor flagellatus TaxID=3162530 RepID=A0AAU7XD76_9HYPH
MRIAFAFLAATALAGGLALAGAAPARAEDQGTSGPQTSGGNLPYINANPQTAQPAPKERSEAAEEELKRRKARDEAASKPADAPKPTEAAKGPDPKPADKPQDQAKDAPKTDPAPATDAKATAEAKPGQAKPGEEPKKDVRVIDLSKPKDKPKPPVTAAGQPPKATTPAQAAPAQAATGQASTGQTNTPAPKADTATAPKPPASPSAAALAAEALRKKQQAAAKAKATEPQVVRGPNGEVYTREQYERRYGALDPQPDVPVQRNAPRAPQAYYDDEEVVIERPRRWSLFPPYYYGDRPVERRPVLRPYEPEPRIRTYAEPRTHYAGQNCHFHAYPVEGMPFHRDVRCHWHRDADDPSLRYVR